MTHGRLRKRDHLDYMRESARNTEEDMVLGLGLPYKERVSEQLTPELREKLDQGKVPMSKAGIDLLVRESERVRGAGPLAGWRVANGGVGGCVV